MRQWPYFGRARGESRPQSGQATTEFVLLIALVSVPIWIAVRLLMQAVLRDFMTALIERFTRG